MDEPFAAAAALASRIAAGDRAAEAELVERYGAPVSYLLRRWTRDPAAAEDLYQETFHLALRKLRAGELRDPERLSGFLRGLARNLFLHTLRRRGLREVGDPEESERLPDPAKGPLRGVLARERSALARQVLAELPVPRDRELLRRHYLAEEEKAEICAALDLPEGHFKRVLFRARRRFRELYEERLAAAAPRETAETAERGGPER